MAKKVGRNISNKIKQLKDNFELLHHSGPSGKPGEDVKGPYQLLGQTGHNHLKSYSTSKDERSCTVTRQHMIAKEMMQLMCESLDEDRLFYD